MAVIRLLLLQLVLQLVPLAWTKNTDRFNLKYGGTATQSGVTTFGLEDWGKLSCTNLPTCQGFPDSWIHAVKWSLPLNSSCQWCPVGTKSPVCGQHLQSPIYLRRENAFATNPNASTFCHDSHWMQYQDGSCNWNDYKSQFAIERHALRIYVPIQSNGQIGCSSGPLFPRIDYSHGFPDWWFLQHTEIKCPSEHFQNGKQYGCEVVLSHFYSVTSGNKAGQVAIFLEPYPEQDCWPFLDKLICQWRQVEEKVRSACGLDPAPPYPGCQLFRTQKTSVPTPAPVQGSGETPIVDCKPYQVHNINIPNMCSECCGWLRSDSNFCLSVYQTFGNNLSNACYNCCEKLAATLAPANPLYPSIDCTTISNPSQICETNKCCESKRSNSTFCQASYKKYGTRIGSICYHCCKFPKKVGPPIRRLGAISDDMAGLSSASSNEQADPRANVLTVGMHGRPIQLDPENFRPKEDDEAYFQKIHDEFTERKLTSTAPRAVDFADVFYWPYEWMVAVQTEYYFRYVGSLTVPPCYETVNWRIMKDPIRVCDRQIQELQRLLASRVAPKSSSSSSCKSDTAGRATGKVVNFNRPLQNTTELHRQVFCECVDWVSKFPGDQSWCKGWRSSNRQTRWFTHPYNFDNNGF